MAVKKLFRVSIYDASANFPDEESYKRYSEGYAVAENMADAEKLARANLKKGEVLAGITEQLDARFFIKE